MARGMPHVWGLLVGVPAVAAGLYVSLAGSALPTLLGVPFVLLGAFAVLVGFYIERVAPEAMAFDERERELVRLHPSQVAAKALVGAGVGFLPLTVYLLVWTRVPYVYPTLTFVGFVVCTFQGLVRYWQNSLTTYYVTDRRVMCEYRFLSLKRNAIKVENITATGRRHTVLESLLGLGTVAVSAGGGSPDITEIRFRDVEQPERAESVIDGLLRGSEG